MSKTLVKPTSIEQNSTNRFVSDAEKVAWNAKQAALVSGINIKTVNGVQILGTGSIAVGDVTLTGSQTLTNKTLTQPILNNPTGAGLVTDSQTQTLINKTLTNPIITLDGTQGLETQVLTSRGAGLQPIWIAPSGGDSPAFSAF